MLFAIASNGDLRQVTTIPHLTDYNNWRSRLDDPAFQTIYDNLFNLIDGNEIQTAGWIPGANWRGTDFWPIYDRACNRDVTASAKFFGLLVWQVVMDHPERWSFGRYEKDGVPIESMTYFRIK
ncbi:hypothetical protein GC197_09890 [bacterium]|nr:hypothetical protein [bacterium]